MLPFEGTFDAVAEGGKRGSTVRGDDSESSCLLVKLALMIWSKSSLNLVISF
jgi:hypothetical protein